MPPKRKEEKKQEEEMELMQIQWVSLFISVDWHPYLGEIEAAFPKASFAAINRASLLAHAKEKGYSDGVEITAELLARAFKEKVFVLEMPGRKAKKEQMQKIEQLQKSRQDSIDKGNPNPDIQVPTLDENQVDKIFVLEDYPANEQEALALGNAGIGVHLALYIRPDPQEKEEKFQNLWTEYEASLQNEESSESPVPEPPVLPPDYPSMWSLLQDTALRADKDSPMRNLVTLILEYKEQEEPVVEVEQSQGKNRPSKLEARRAMKKTTVKESTESKESKKEEVKKEEAKRPPAKGGKDVKKSDDKSKKEEEVPEEPEQPPERKDLFCTMVVQKIQDTGSDYIKYANWLKGCQVKALFPSPAGLEESKTSYLDVEESKEIRESKDMRVSKDSKVTYSITPESSMALQSQKPPPGIPSLDDAPRAWDFRRYHASLGTFEEPAVSVETILASMVKQLSPVEETEFEDPLAEEARLTATVFEKTGAEFFPGKDEYGQSNPQAPLVHCQNRSAWLALHDSEAATLQEGFLEETVLPGTKRHMLSERPEKSEALRRAERCELYPFCTSFHTSELERALVLSNFESALTEYAPGVQWDFSDRIYLEKLPPRVLKQVLTSALLSEPELLPCYYPRDDSLLLAVYQPAGTDRTARKEWQGNWKVRPAFKDWIGFFREAEDGLEFVDVDGQKAGSLLHCSTTLLPNDGSAIKVFEFSVPPSSAPARNRERPYDTKKLVQVTKDNVTMGVRKGRYLSEFWACFNDGARFLAEASPKGASMTYSLPEGLTLKTSPAGSLVQQLSEARMELRLKVSAQFRRTKEQSRAICPDGTVVRYFEDGEIELLFANGNISSKIESRWVCTNNKGMRTARDLLTGEEEELESVPCTLLTDPHISARTLVREDLVTIITYEDNSKITEHADGTRFFTSSDGSEVTVEAPGYAPVRVFLDSGVREAYLPRESWLSVNSDTTKLYRHDRSVTQLDVLSAEVRLLVGKEAREIESQALEREVPLSECASGIYTANLTQGKLSVTDDLACTYSVFADGSYQHSAPPPPVSNEEEVEENKPTIRTPPPRLFVISSDGEGVELLSEQQIDEYVQTLRPETLAHDFTFDKFKVCAFAEPSSSSLLDVGLLPNSPLSNYFRPSVLDEVQIPRQLVPPVPASYVQTRALVQFPPFSQRTEFQQSLQEFHDWKNSQLTKLCEFGVQDYRTEEEKQRDFKIKTAVLQHRQEYVGEKLPADAFYETVSTELQSEAKAQDEAGQMAEFERDIELTYSELNVTEDEVKDTTLRQPGAKRKTSYKPAMDAGGTDFFKYFSSTQGTRFLKENPPIERPASAAIKPLKQVHVDDLPEEEVQHFEAMKESLNQPVSSHSQQQTSGLEKSDNPYITLEYESKPHTKKKPRQVVLKPVKTASCFTEVERLQKLKQEAEAEAAEEYTFLKSKNFDVYGLPRTQKNMVNSIRKTSPHKEPNERFILIESATDRRNKISSQSVRAHAKAPSVQSMQRDGTHDVLYKALLKKQTYKEMMDTQNMMISAYILDPLKRSIQLIPATIRFGVLKVFGSYRTKLVLKNEDTMMQRFNIRQPEHPYVKVVYKPSPIAPGISFVIDVEITPQDKGIIETEFCVTTKADIFKVPVYANVLSEDEFNRINSESLQLNKRGVIKNTVQIKGESSEKWEESGTSDLQLPVLPNLADIQVDPQKSLDEVLRSLK